LNKSALGLQQGHWTLQRRPKSSRSGFPQPHSGQRELSLPLVELRGVLLCSPGLRGINITFPEAASCW
jgi:hypothetical protein